RAPPRGRRWTSSSPDLRWRKDGLGKEIMDDRTFHDFSATSIDGEPVDLGAYRGGPVLVVNTATQCAFTPQLRGLQELHERFSLRLRCLQELHDRCSQRSFRVLGFPSDQFHQVPGSDEDTQEPRPCQFSVTFPLCAKTDVSGPDAPPMWRWLCAQRPGVMGGR